MKKNIVKTILFLSIFILIIGKFHNIFRFKYEDGIYGLDTFYRLENNSVDVLILGSSHSFVDINPAVLYNEYGIAGFDLGGSVQPFWNTYYYVKEALKTQKPKVIVLEAFASTLPNMYSDESRIIKNNYGLKFSKDKIEAVQISTPDGKIDYLMEWIMYHNRYMDINKSDFGKYLGNKNKYENWKGHYPLSNCIEYQHPIVNEINGNIQMLDKEEIYYRKIIELVQKEDIPLVILVSPYAGYNTMDAELLFHARAIAEECGVPFINYNEKYEEISLDFATDCADLGHLNYLGSEKLTKDIGEYLVRNYNIEDRREDLLYESWEKDAKYYYQYVQNIELKKITELEMYLKMLEENMDNYLIVVSEYGDSAREIIDRLDWMNIEDNKNWKGGTWVIDRGDVTSCLKKDDYYFYHIELENSDLVIKGEEECEEVIFDREILYTAGNGINICVWNAVTGEIADNVRFNPEKDWIGER